MFDYMQDTAAGSARGVSSVTSPYSYADTASFLNSDLSGWLNRIQSLTSSNNAVSLSAARQQQDWSAEQARISREFNAAEAAKNRDWQKMMSDTAHQREIADLQAAGLNPVLSAMNGNGASVTSGAAASSSVPSGSKADTDESTASALVGLLGSLLSYQQHLQSTEMSALSSLALADKYNATSELVSRISAGALIYGSDRSFDSSVYGTNAKFLSDVYGIRQSGKNVKYSSDKSYKGVSESSDKALFGKLIGDVLGFIGGFSG